MTFVRLCIFFTLYISVVHSHGKCNNPPDFSEFKRCLLGNGGTSEENLVWRSNSSRYVELNYQWQQKGTYRYPKAYVLVHNDLEVTRVIRCAKKHSIHLVTKGGGHNLAKYAFGTNSSVIVDVRYLTEFTVDKVNWKARLGSGHLNGPLSWNLWTTADAFIPLGECSSVGIAGLALGGGWGNFAQTYGLTQDSILGITVVLANGSVCNTSSDKYPDLFWALRGAGSTSFGIVTSFTVRLFPAPPILFVGMLYYRMIDFPKLYAAWQVYCTDPSDRVSTQLTFLGKEELSVRFTDPTGQASTFERLLKNFPRPIKITRDIFSFQNFLFHQSTILTFSNPSDVYGLDRPSDLANVTRSSARAAYIDRRSFYVSQKVDTKSILAWVSFLLTIPSSVGVWWEGYGAKINTLKVNDTAFVHRGNILYNAAANYRQISPSRKDVVSRKIWLRKFFTFGRKLFKHNESYQNYVDTDLLKFNERYYGRNLPKLIELKRKYDPDNFFNNPQSIPLKSN